MKDFIKKHYTFIALLVSLFFTNSLYTFGVISLSSMARIDDIVLSVITTALSFLFLKNYIPKIKKTNWLIILPISILYYLLFLSPNKIIYLDAVSKVIVLILLIIVSINFKIPKEKYLNKKNIICFIMLTFINTFLFVGHPLFFMNNHFYLSLAQIIKFITFSFFLIPIQLAIIHNLLNFKIKDNNGSSNYKLIWLILFLIMSGIWIIMLCGYYPMNMSSDGVDQVLQALGVNRLSNSHPAIMAIAIRMIFKIVKSTFVVGIVQIILFASVFSSIFTYFIKKGINKKIIIVLTVLFALLPNNYMYATTLYKDVPYTIFLTYISFLLFKLIIEEKQFFKWHQYLVFPISITMCYFYRHNGPGPVILTIITLLIFAKKIKSIKPIIISMIAIVLILIIKYPIYSAFNVYYPKSNQSVSKFNTLIKRTAGAILNSGSSLSKESNEIISRTSDPKLLKKYFNKYDGDTYGWNKEMEAYVKNLKEKKDVTNKDVLIVYFDFLHRHPYQTVKERMDATNILWSVSQPSDGYNHRYADGVWYPMSYNKNANIDIINVNPDKEKIAYIQKNSIVKMVRNFRDYLTKYTIFDWILWRTGIWWCLILICSFVLLIKNKTCIYSLVPIVGNTLTYLPTLCWQIYRYVWYVFVFAVIYFFFTIIAINKKSDN